LVGHRQAHRWLDDLRAQGQDRDLTHSALPWRTYLACHRDGEDVVGPGVVAFLFRFLNEWDSNTRENRADFVVRRVDGTDVRLHPGSSRESQLIKGQLQDWLNPHAYYPPAPQELRIGPAAPPPRHTEGDVARLC
jgi:hypothetical protein